MRVPNALLLVAMILFASESYGPAYAYLDPGTGSMMLQALMAGVVGGLAIGRLYWTRLKSLLGRNVKSEDILEK